MKTIKKTSNKKWIVTIVVWSFILTFLIGLLTEKLANALPVIIAIFILLLIILTGVFFDILGVAVNVADESVFHAMAANHNKTAKHAITLCKNSEKVSSFCNDVIGDICGIISGAIGTGIILRIAEEFPTADFALFTATFASLISALTIGAKARGKIIATTQSDKLVFGMSKVLQFGAEKLGIHLFKNG